MNAEPNLPRRTFSAMEKAVRRHPGLRRSAFIFTIATVAAVVFGMVGSCAQAAESPTAASPQPATSVANNFYVSMEGDDSSDGSSSHPWATIQHAAEHVTPGDTVHVAPGLYPSPVNSRVSGTSSARIRFISDVKWGAKIVARSSYTVWENSGDYVDIAGFDITGDGNLGILNLGSFVAILGNHVHNIPAKCTANGGAGIDQGNFSGHDNDTIGNLVHNIGDVNVPCARVQGIYHANLRGHVWNNIAFSNQGYGIHLWHAPMEVVVANNLVFHNGDGGILVGAGDAPGGVTADGMVVTNNIIVDNGTWGAGWAIVESGQTGTHNLYSTNIILRNRRGIGLQNGRDVGTINSDPMLQRYASDGSGDYHPTPSSPAIEAGTQAGAPRIDFDGRARPTSLPDIGAYQSGSGSPVWPY